jgi:hypothetical protein
MGWVWLSIFVAVLLLAYYGVDQLDKQDERKRQYGQRAGGKK